MSIYLITGASGYIGSMLTKHLLANRGDCEIIASVRSLEKAKMIFSDGLAPVRERGLSDKDGILDRLKFVQGDLYDGHFMKRLCKETDHIDYIVHCASVTASSEMIQHPVESIQSIINATQNVLELARHYEIKSMVYLSSMEVYGDMESSNGHRVTEQEVDRGRVELLNMRSCYPLGKRMSENICYGYFKEYGVPVKIARLAQTFGHGILPSDHRVFAQFARSVKSGTDIILHTEGNSMGNYCGIEDAIEGIRIILEHGQNGEAYNVVNEENTMMIRQMAELIASQVAGGRIGVRRDIPKDGHYGYAADTGLRLSGEKLMRLGWRPKKKLVEMYRDMLEDL